MIRHALGFVLGIAFVMSGAAVRAQGPLAWDGSLNSARALSMFYGEQAPVSTALGQMGASATTIFPVTLTAVNTPRLAASHGTASDPSKDSPEEVPTEKTDRYYYGGEIGAFYGHTSGKFGGNEYGSYMMGTIGTDKFQISAGASYDEMDFHLPRRFR